jgi:hypothetical protein
MKTIKSVSVLALAIFVITINLHSCTKSYHEEPLDSSEIRTKSDTSESKTIILDLYIEFWTNLSSNSISDIQNAIDEGNYNELIRLAKFSEEEISSFMELVSLHSEPQSDSFEATDCNCLEDGTHFSNIISFVEIIQQSGGAVEFFSNGPDWDRIYLCLGGCYMTCLSLQWNLPAWTACYAACTALCYYLPN